VKLLPRTIPSVTAVAAQVQQAIRSSAVSVIGRTATGSLPLVAGPVCKPALKLFRMRCHVVIEELGRRPAPCCVSTWTTIEISRRSTHAIIPLPVAPVSRSRLETLELKPSKPLPPLPDTSSAEVPHALSVKCRRCTHEHPQCLSNNTCAPSHGCAWEMRMQTAVLLP